MTVTVYEVEFEEEFFEGLQDKIEEIDPSRNYSKKNTVEKACKLTKYLLEKEYDEHSKDLDRIKKEIQDLEDVIK